MKKKFIPFFLSIFLLALIFLLKIIDGFQPDTYNNSVSRKILDKNIICLNLNADSVTLQNVILEQPIIVFRFSDKHCLSCVESHLRTFYKSHLYEKLKENLVILSNYDEFRNFQNTLNIYEYGFKAFNINCSLFPLESDLAPYLMLIDTNFVVNDIYILEANNEIAVDNYLQSIYNAYYKIDNLE